MPNQFVAAPSLSNPPANYSATLSSGLVFIVTWQREKSCCTPASAEGTHHDEFLIKELTHCAHDILAQLPWVCYHCLRCHFVSSSTHSWPFVS
jgi:hypothetical protein